MIGSPQTAPPRSDLPFLRRRSRAKASQPVVPAVADFISGKTPSHHHHAASPGGGPSTLGRPPEAAPPTPVSSSLDLSPASPDPRVPVSSSLDLSAPAPPPTRAPSPVQAPQRTYLPPRTRKGAPTILSPKEPSVTLTRIQSGVGVLTFEAACSDAVGDLRLGCAYQLRSGPTSVVQHASGVTSGPPGSRRPVLVGHRGAYEKLTLDLSQVRDVERLIVYAFSDSGASLNWGGTLVLTTFGQVRIELPLDRPASGGVVVLLSLFNIAGELVLRAEAEQVPGSVRDACLAFGFDEITWLDARTPLV